MQSKIVPPQIAGSQLEIEIVPGIRSQTNLRVTTGSSQKPNIQAGIKMYRAVPRLLTVNIAQTVNANHSTIQAIRANKTPAARAVTKSP